MYCLHGLAEAQLFFHIQRALVLPLTVAIADS